MNSFLSLTKNKIYKSEIEINKSRFLGFAKHTNSTEEAKQFVLDLKKQYQDARHVVYAYIVDGMQKSSDDGEPSGTAGRPILEMLLHQNCNQIVVVVVRYFGGIKLGAGGLLRAYVQTAKQTINQDLKTYNKGKVFEGQFDYKSFKDIKQSLKQRKIKELSLSYGQNIEYSVVCFDDQDIPGMKYKKDIFETFGGEDENN